MFDTYKFYDRSGKLHAFRCYQFEAQSEHVTIVGDGEDFHSSDSVRQLMEVGYWGTLDVESVS